jgi:glycosyltransferase involved in cell wall biosynthesis
MMLTVHGLLHVEKMNILKRKFSLKHLYQCVVQSFYEFRMLNCAKQIIVDTYYVAKQIEAYKQAGYIKQIPEMHVIPQGINEKYVELHSSPNSRTMLSVGAISKRKGHLYLLQAFDLLCKKLNDVNLVIAGVLAEQSYYQEMMTYVQNSPNADKIKILTNLPQNELFKLYTQAQLFALHTQEESQGIVFAEAMATGLPVVATNVGGVPYVVQDGCMGLLSDYGNVEEFCSNIYRVLTQEDVYEQFSSNATKCAQAYLWKNVADKVMMVYITL